MPRKLRFLGKTAGQRAYDLRRAGEKRLREGRERNERRSRQLAKGRPGCLLPAVIGAVIIVAIRSRDSGCPYRAGVARNLPPSPVPSPLSANSAARA